MYMIQPGKLGITMVLKTRYYNGGEKPVREVLSRHPYLVHNEKVI